MINFFKKIRQKFIAKNKFNQYLLYAIGEIILVMVGILLALQVSNWNQQRVASNKEKILLSELHQEFIENKEQFKLVVSNHQLAFDICDKWIAMFPIDLKTVNLDSLPIRTDGLHKRWTFNPSQGIVNSLVSTSSFELISNRELRKLLVSWNDVLLDFQEDELHSKKYVMEVLNPFINKHFHYKANYSDPRLNISILESAEFENLILQRKEYLIDILGIGYELSRIQKTIDRIIELSNPD
tara:strand:- start:757 stop:1476 length:720 start_codon:yes stop_codon:yes gene_type:complete